MITRAFEVRLNRVRYDEVATRFGMLFGSFGWIYNSPTQLWGIYSPLNTGLLF